MKSTGRLLPFGDRAVVRSSGNKLRLARSFLANGTAATVARQRVTEVAAFLLMLSCRYKTTTL